MLASNCGSQGTRTPGIAAQGFARVNARRHAPVPLRRPPDLSHLRRAPATSDTGLSGVCVFRVGMGRIATVTASRGTMAGGRSGVTSSGRPGVGWVRMAWLVPAAVSVTAVGFLCWGAWRTGYDPGWLANGDAYWLTVLRPDQSWALPVMLVLWLAVLSVFWWPRRYERLPVGLIAVAVMVVLAAVLGTVSYVPCRGGLSMAGVVFWVLQLFVGQPAPVYPGATVCTGSPPPALQVAQVSGLAATLTGAVTAGSALWRPPLERLRSLLTQDATVFTGLDELTLPLLRLLVTTAASPHQVIVIEPDEAHPLLGEARATGARILIGNPASTALLDPIIAGRRGLSRLRLYALRGDDDDNEAMLASARLILRRYQPSTDGAPRLVVRADDIRQASYWREAQNEPGALVFEDAISVDECTAQNLARQLMRARPGVVLLCGDGSLGLALLLELARRSWEEAEMAAAALAGRSAQASPGAASQPPLPDSARVERVIVLDPYSEEIRDEYLQRTPPTILARAPNVIAHREQWQGALLRSLDALPMADAERAAVVIIGSISDIGMHEAERAARLHPEIPVFVQSPPGGGRRALAAAYGLRLFTPGLLVDGEIPDDAWARVARFWYECYRLSHPVPPGDRRTATRLPWPELDSFTRDENVLQLRSIMTAIADLGRLWIPVRMVPPGSFIELGERELESVAAAEHTRWLKRRLAVGWAAGWTEDDGWPWPRLRRRRSAGTQTHKLLVPWADLPPDERALRGKYVRTQIAQLEDIGFLPVVPAGGPPGAVTVTRAGLVSARRLTKRTRWTLSTDQQVQGNKGDWRLADDDGEAGVMTNAEFLASHEPADDGRWRCLTTFRAWQTSETLIIRTKDGTATASPGDWVVESADGSRRPVEDEKFRQSYCPCPPRG